MPSCASHFLHTHSHTHTKGLGPWASRTRWVGTHLLPEPLSMLGGAAGMGHVGTRGTRWYGVNCLVPFGPHVVVCVQGQMGVFTTQSVSISHLPGEMGSCLPLPCAPPIPGAWPYTSEVWQSSGSKSIREKLMLFAPGTWRSKASVAQTESWPPRF